MRPTQLSPLPPTEAAALYDAAAKADPGQAAALPFFDADHRAGALTLMAFFAELKALPARVSEPPLGEIRLQWWRDALEEVFGDGRVRAHPLVEALSQTLSARNDLRSLLDAAIDGTARFLGPETSSETPSEAGELDAALGVATIHDGTLSKALLAYLGGDEAAQQNAATLSALRAVAMGAALAPSARRPNTHGIETPAERLRTLLHHQDRDATVAEAVGRWQACWRSVVPLPPLLVPAHLALKPSGGRIGASPAGEFRRKINYVMTVLRGR